MEGRETEQKVEAEPDESSVVVRCVEVKPLVFKLGKEVTNHVRIFLKARGWEEAPEDDQKGGGSWNLIWQDRLYEDSRHANARLDQRLNHFQNTKGICRKDMLALNLARVRATFGADLFDFVPTTFILPRQKDEFVTAFESERSLWIYKPSASARGRGIFVFDDLKCFWAEGALPCIVQAYIPRPLTVGGYKFDLRLYCLISSFWPLKCYLHTKGLVRFSSQKYDLSSLSNRFAHLTNFSINKTAPKRLLSPEDDRVIGQGCKWTLDQLWGELREWGMNVERIWHSVKRLVLLTLLPLVGEVPRDTHCYELLGFDVLLDTSGKAWLLEVNRSPAMACSTAPDKAVKKVVLSDMFHLLGLDMECLRSGEEPEGRTTGGFEQLFPFNPATQHANDSLVTACPPPTPRADNMRHSPWLATCVKQWLAVTVEQISELYVCERNQEVQEQEEEEADDADDE